MTHRHSDSGPGRTPGRPAGLCARLAAGLTVLLVFWACAPTEPAEGALLKPDGSSVYADGVFAASFSHTLPDGWRPYLQIHVKAGLIDEACFGAVGSDGVRVRESESYVEQFRLDTGVALDAYLDAFVSDLLAMQALPVAIPESTLDVRVGWASVFGILADAVLAGARDAVSLPIEVNAAGPYLEFDRPNELGWDARMAIVFAGSEPVAVSFQERREGPDGEVRVMSVDPVSIESYERVIGLTPAGVVTDLASRFLEAGYTEDGTPGLEAVTGATGTTDRFNVLASRIPVSRIPAELPGRLCAD